MIDQLIYGITHPFTLMIMGLFAHFGRKILASVAHETDQRPCFTDYWKKNPIQTGMSLIGATAGYAMFAHFPDFHEYVPEIQNVIRATAFGVGYMADSVVDAVGEKVTKRIKGETQ